MAGYLDSQADWQADLGNGFYKNPILRQDLPEPDLVRVGPWFFLLSARPGLPILHSQDLVNWSLASFVTGEPGSSRQKEWPGHGARAATIRFWAGLYHVFFCLPAQGLYLSQAKDPFGSWPEPVLVQAGPGWLDTCPFCDDDGQTYLVHACGRGGKKSGLELFRLSPSGSSLLGPGREIMLKQPVPPALLAPKMFRRQGFYYIFAADDSNRQLLVLRSQSLLGPYTAKPVLAQGNTDVNGPYRGGWTELESGQSWFVHSQARPSHGQVTHLQPINWQDGWPLPGRVSDGLAVGQPVPLWEKPLISL
jgi:beta-xylosidase